MITWFGHISKRIYTFSLSSKKCSNETMFVWCSERWILISDISWANDIRQVEISAYLLLCSVLCERSFADNLCCVDLLRFQIAELVALCETTLEHTFQIEPRTMVYLAEESTLGVLSYDKVSLRASFLYDRLLIYDGCRQEGLHGVAKYLGLHPWNCQLIKYWKIHDAFSR